MQQFELSEELVSQIEGLIKANNKEDVAKLVEPLHPADIAEITTCSPRSIPIFCLIPSMRGPSWP